MPEGTVKSRINRGRTELARQIRKLRGDDFSTNDAVGRNTAKNSGKSTAKRTAKPSGAY